MNPKPIVPSRELCFNLCKSIIVETLSKHRSNAWLDASEWAESDRLDGPIVAMDSLGVVEAASELSTLLQLHTHKLDELPLRSRSFSSWIEIVQKSWGQGIDSIVFKTSGTTGSPKRIERSYIELLQEAKAWSKLLRPFNRIILCVPSHHIYGFIFGLLLASESHSPVTDATSWTPHQIYRGIKEHDLIISHPAQWRLMANAGFSFPPNVNGITSTGPIHTQLAQELGTLGLKQLIDIFGSTETGGIGFRNALEEKDYQLCPWWIQTNRGVRHTTSDSPLIAMDHLLWKEDQRFSILGRIDNFIQISGTNINLTSIESRINKAPNVVFCKLHFIEEIDGGKLHATLETNTSQKTKAEFRTQLWTWFQNNLTPSERPVSIEIRHIEEAPTTLAR